MKHTSINIRGAIALPDSELQSWIGKMYDSGGKAITNVREIRLALAEELAEGHIYIRSMGCDNFNPCRGCLGHEGERT